MSKGVNSIQVVRLRVSLDAILGVALSWACRSRHFRMPTRPQLTRTRCDEYLCGTAVFEGQLLSNSPGASGITCRTRFQLCRIPRFRHSAPISHLFVALAQFLDPHRTVGSRINLSDNASNFSAAHSRRPDPEAGQSEVCEVAVTFLAKQPGRYCKVDSLRVGFSLALPQRLLSAVRKARPHLRTG